VIALLPWRALGVYFAVILAAMLASLPLASPTLLAVKAAPPWAVALAGSLAAALAALFDWHFVRRAFRLKWLMSVRQHRLFERAERWSKVAPFLTILAFAALPLPFWIMRVLMPATGYPRGRYVAATALGRFPRLFVIAAFGTVVELPSWLLIAAFAAGVVLAALGALARKMGWIGKGESDAESAPPPPAP
jgi:uncharacterized membrane protein YdjX (TVP38/TMEM64 family)